MPLSHLSRRTYHRKKALRLQGKSFLRWPFIAYPIIGFILVLADPLSAATLEGRVWNGTTSQPVSGVEVEYVQLQQGMTPVARAGTDAQGRFRFEGVEAYGSAPALLRVAYQGATYSQPMMAPQSAPTDLQVLVYEASRDRGIVSRKEHILFLYPTGDTLEVIEQIFLENRSSPPRAYVDPQGTYRFTLPGAPREGVRASIEGTAGMPIPQTPVAVDAQSNRFAITYPIRPGETSLRVEYAVDYQQPSEFVKTLDEVADATFIVTPNEGVQVSGDNIMPAGADPASGFSAYRVTPVENVVRAQVSGQAPERQTAETDGSSGTLTPILDPASQRRWILLGPFGLILLAGFVYLYTR
jgi:hypothetical protein